MRASNLRRLGWTTLALALAALVLVTAQAVAQKAAVGRAVEVRVVHCRRGDALLSLGRVTAAETAYEAALEHEATVECAREGLAKIGGERPCAAAKALWRNGGEEESHGVYVESLEQKPMRECAAMGVEKSAKPDTARPEKQSFLEWLEDTASTAVDLAKNFLLLLAVVVLVLFTLYLLIARVLTKLPCTKRRATRYFARPSVTVETVDDSGLEQKLGAAVTALLRQHLELDAGDGALKLASGEATQAETWIATVSGAGDYGKLIGLVIFLYDLARPKHRINIGGALQAATPAKGHGLSLTVYRANRAGTSTTLWASGFGLSTATEPEAVQGLAVPAAAWASYVIADQTSDENMLGAGDALSWALFKAGSEQQAAQGPDQVAGLYEEALVRDPGNYGALTNLGVIEARLREYTKALVRLEEALKNVESRATKAKSDKGDKAPTDPDWYRIKYSLTSERFNCAEATRRWREVEQARQDARELLIAIRKRLKEKNSSRWMRCLPRRQRTKRRLAALRKLDDFLDTEFEPAVLVLLAGIELFEQSRGGGAQDEPEQGSLEEMRELIAAGKPVSPFALVRKVERPRAEPVPELSFNLACFYSQAWRAEGSPEDSDLLKRARIYTRSCLDETAPSEWGRLYWEIKTDPFLEPVRDLARKHAERLD
jgi:tetratricopeptide (TPR) repeat protein